MFTMVQGVSLLKKPRSRLSVHLNLVLKLNYISYPVVVRFSPAFRFSFLVRAFY